MNKGLELRLVLVFITLGACFTSSPRSDAPSCPRPDIIVSGPNEEKSAEQVFRNIQVLKGMPASQLQQVMALFTGALGVKCNHCHTNPFDKDDRPAKQTARRMIQMVFELNRTNFSGSEGITCYTCHRGHLTPETVVTLGQNQWLMLLMPEALPAKLDVPMPTTEQILDHYIKAMGGRESLAKLTSRISRGSRVGADGVLVPEAVYQKAPDKLLVITTYPGNEIRAGISGGRGWAGSKDGVSDISGEELAELQREATFNKELSLPQLYSQMTPAGKVTINERETYVVEARSRSGHRERLYFDTQNGLLLRRYRESTTVLGPFPLQTDYEDYQTVDGVKLPLTIRWSMPGRVWSRRIAEVKHQVPIEDEQFNPPAAKR